MSFGDIPNNLLIPMDDGQTLPKYAPPDPTKSLIENQLELTPLAKVSPDLFTNTRPLWHPPGARGIFGGISIAQCLCAAQSTVPTNFTIHSMHCYFVLAGNADIPIMYHVERVREGNSFAIRTVRAMQQGRSIFTSTMSFARVGSGGKRLVEHAEPMPPKIPVPKDVPEDALDLTSGADDMPYITKRVGILNIMSPYPHKKRTHQWVKACGKISTSGGHQAHLAAMAYMSDSYFIGVIPRIHKIWRFASPPLTELTTVGTDLQSNSKVHSEIDIREREETPALEGELLKIGMMVSLDHTIFFHDPFKVKADEWMLTELESHWAGNGRGLAYQKIWTKDGTLIASCVQEVCLCIIFYA